MANTLDMTTAFFNIVKADRNPDGTLMVYGKATDDSLDIDQQICDAAWLDRAMPDWFKSGGNIREQHSNIAAGVAKEYEKKNDGHYIHALVVDPVSVKKVDTGVLKGFSIGIKSPRVVRDQKAVNGRIIDGQIVEVSLVDRPANPNAKLMLAKSVEGETNLIQVEEFVAGDTLQSEVTKGGKSLTAQEVIELSKKFRTGVIEKFDKKLYDAARKALADLIALEAAEMGEGHNEEMSLSHLLSAVHHLFAWYEGEKQEGEVVEEVEDIALAAKKDMTPKKDESKSDFMKRCKEAGMDDDAAEKAYDKYMKSVEIDGDEKAEKTAEVSKCLECGCATPGADHGATTTNDFANVAMPSHVTTAEMVSPSESPKSAEADETPAEEKTEEKVEEEVKEPADAEVSEEAPASADVEAIVEKAVKSATESIRAEVASLLSAKEAAETKAASLESELAVAKSLAVAGGPKRTAKPIDTKVSDNLTKAAVYRAKANATTDPLLIKGYKALAEKFATAAETESK